MRINGPGLKLLRELRGLNQTGLSEASGVSVSYLSQIERGRPADVRGPVLKKLADALGIEVAALPIADVAEVGS